MNKTLAGRYEEFKGMPKNEIGRKHYRLAPDNFYIYASSKVHLVGYSLEGDAIIQYPGNKTLHAVRDRDIKELEKESGFFTNKERGKQIVLTQGRVAMVDEADYDWLNQYKWCFGCKGYAMRNRCEKNADGKPQSISMHRLIMNSPKGMYVDHKNGNTLDNRRENLRVCTNAQNQANRQKHRTDATSKYKGIFWVKKYKRWLARIKDRHIGTFLKEEDAARAWDVAAKEEFGDFARLNFPAPEILHDREVVNAN